MTAAAVIMAVYGRDDPDGFRDALRSLVDQLLPDGVAIHIYLGVDGPIGPDLEAVIEDSAAHLHLVHRSPRNIGLGPILNTLIERLGDETLVFRMDADDRSLPTRCSRQIAFLNDHADIDIVGTAIIEHDVVSGRRIIVRFADGPDAARRQMPKRPPVAHPTACFRRRVFDMVGGYPDVPFSEDIALWFKCLEAGLRFDNVREPLYEFTISPNFWKRRGLQKAWREYRAWSGGVHRLEGPTWRLAYPLARLLMRIGPKRLQRFLYERRAGDIADIG